jgi:hypothetical protein
LVILVEAVYLNGRNPKIYDSSRLLDKNKTKQNKTSDDSDCKESKNQTMTLLVFKAVIKAGRRSSRRTLARTLKAHSSLAPTRYKYSANRPSGGGPVASSGIMEMLGVLDCESVTTVPTSPHTSTVRYALLSPRSEGPASALM